MRALIVAPALIVLGAVALVCFHAFDATSSGNQPDSTLRPECGSRCAFELLYNTSNGHIVGASAWDPTVPFSPQPGASHFVREGEATLVFTEHPDALLILEHPDEYYVDLETKTVKIGPNPQIDPDAWPPAIPSARSEDHIAARTDGHSCSPHPCEGWRYAVLYRTDDRSVRWITGFDARSRWKEQEFPINPAEGEALLEVTDNPHIEDILALVLTGNGGILRVDEDDEIKVEEGHSILVIPIRKGSEDLECHFHPCPGFVYDLRYATDTGETQFFSVYRCVPPDSNCGQIQPITPGTARLDIADDPLLSSVLNVGFDKFAVDVPSLRLVPLAN